MSDPNSISKGRVCGAGQVGCKRRRRVRGSGSLQSGFACRAGCSARWWCIGLDIVNPSSNRIMFDLPFLGGKLWFIIVANDMRIEKKCGRIKSEHGNMSNGKNKLTLFHVARASLWR